MISYFLGLCGIVDEVRKLINDLNIWNVSFNESLPLTYLHWMISDKNTCIVLEQTMAGLKVYDNYVGVMTNNPTFDYHLMNLNNYMNLTASYGENRFSKDVSLSQYGVGMGAIGLPGDNSFSGRFVRVSFNKFNSKCDLDETSSIIQVFHLLDSVAMIKGTTLTKDNKFDITTYSCCINKDKEIYYYKTYSNNRITAIKMNDELKNKQELSIFELRYEQEVMYEN